MMFCQRLRERKNPNPVFEECWFRKTGFSISCSNKQLPNSWEEGFPSKRGQLQTSCWFHKPIIQMIQPNGSQVFNRYQMSTVNKVYLLAIMMSTVPSVLLAYTFIFLDLFSRLMTIQTVANSLTDQSNENEETCNRGSAKRNQMLYSLYNSQFVSHYKLHCEYFIFCSSTSHNYDCLKL